MASDNISENERAPTTEESPASLQINSAIDKILANPELISMVASALGSAPQKNSSSSNDSKKERESLPIKENISDNASSGASDGNITEKLPELIATLAPMLSSLQGSAAVSAKPSPHHDRRSCLLNALKPYLCKERCEAIDYMIRLGKLAEIFQNLS